MRTRRCIDGTSTCCDDKCPVCIDRRPKCAACGDPISRRAFFSCSKRSCKLLNQYAREQGYKHHGERIACWLADESSPGGHNGRDRAGLAGWARNYLLSEANHACTECGWNTPHPSSGVPPLEVDHIDGDRNNNLRSNVRVLCPNCHSLTPTNKGRNRNAYSAVSVRLMANQGPVKP